MPQVECRGEPAECPQVAGLLGSPAFPIAMPAGPPAPGQTLVALTPTQLAWIASGAPTVASVFGRLGVVVAQLGDYAASLVSNDSTVAGATVKDALDTLDAAFAALAAALAGLQASSVGNDSTVAGATVKDALDTLGAAVLRPSFLHWGSNSVSATTTTRYMPPGYDSALGSLTPIQYRIPAACTLRNLRVRHNVPGGNGNLLVYTVRKNGVPTALTASLASTGSDASDLVNAIAFAAGDLLDIEVTKAASVGTSPNDITAILEVAQP